MPTHINRSTCTTQLPTTLQAKLHANVSARNRDIRIRYYVYTTNHARQHKSRSAAVGPFAVLDADIATYISDMARQDCNSIAAATTIVDPRVDLP